MKKVRALSVSGEAMQQSDDNLTMLLRDWSQGDGDAAGRIFERLYPQLKSVAQRQLAQERAGHTIQPTALVHEAYLKFQRGAPVEWQDRAHFFAIASRIIRQILVDYGRSRNAQRRGGGLAVTLNENVHGSVEETLELLALDEALTRLSNIDECQADIVTLRYFGGLTIDETAIALEVSEATVNRKWRAARAWLYQVMEEAR